MVAEQDLPRAFTPVPAQTHRGGVAGPAFNLMLAVIAYWIIFMAGVTSLKSVVGYVIPVRRLPSQACIRGPDTRGGGS